MKLLDWSVVADNDNNTEIEKKYPLKGDLTKNKLLRYLPALIATNISTMLLVTVDGLVAGNLVGKDALASISFYTPISTVIGALTAVVSTGASILLSLRMGNADTDGLKRAKDAIKKLSIIYAIIVSLVQIPIVFLMINSYNLTGDVLSNMISYAIGVMIATPFSIINTVGVYQLQAIGKMKVLMGMAVLEGGTNLVLDIVFVSVFNMGVAGTGYGTLCANIVRCTVTVVYLVKKSDMYNSGGTKATSSEYKEIVLKGLPDAAYLGVVALQNYLMARIILSCFGEPGGVIKGVTAFAFSVVNVMMSSVQGAARPMVGLLNGVNNKRGVRQLLLQSIMLIVVLAGAIVAVVELWPDLFYTLQGVKEIPGGGELAVRLNAIQFVILGINALFRMYFASRELHNFSTILTVVGNVTVPIFAFVIGQMFDAPYIFLAYTIAQVIILVVNLSKYTKLLIKDKKEDVDIQRVYVSLEPEDAVDASQMIRDFAMEHNYSQKNANRARLCMEEMVAYSVKASKDTQLRNQVMFCFSKDETRFVMLDDGECIMIDDDAVKEELVTDNYGLIKRLADDVEYQYVLDMNHTVVSFGCRG